MRKGLLLALLACTAGAQTPQRVYSLQTVAGTVHTGDGGPATSALLGNIQGVAADRSGNLYISDTDNHRVRKIDTKGVITLFAGTGAAGFDGDGGPAVNASLNLPYGLAADAAGNVYVADLGNNRVRRIAADGTILTIAGSGQGGGPGDGGPATGAQLLAPRNVAVDAAGNLFVSEFFGHRVRKVSPDGQISTVAGTGIAGFGGDGGPAPAAQLAYPAGLAVDGLGHLYVADSQNQRVRQILPAGTISSILGNTAATALLTPTALAIDAAGTIYAADQSNIVRAYTPAGAWINLAGTGGLGFAGDGGAASSAILAAPHDLAVDTNGRLYIADGSRVRRVGIDGVIQTVAGDEHLYGIGDGGDATAAPLFRPSAVALDYSGNFYLAETGAQRIRQVNPAGQIATVAGTGVAGPAGDGGTAANAQLHAPVGVAVDAFGNMMVADASNHRVRQITPGGHISTLIGTGMSGIGRDGLPGTQTALSSPQGVCTNHAGIVYVVDTSNHRVLRVLPGAASVVTVAGNGTAGYAGDGGMARSAQLNRPSACAVDTAGNLFIADTLNNRIRQVTATGTIFTIAGSGAAGFAGDGQSGTSALLQGPAGVAVTDGGNIFIADTGNNRIRLLTSDGVIETIAGGDATPLNTPGGVALDGSGNVYFAETGSNLVRKLTPGLAFPTAAFSGPAISIVNSASMLPGPVAPGEVVTVFGAGLGPAIGVAGPSGAAGATEVRFDGIAVPVFYAQAGQVNVQVPYSVAANTVTSVEVRYKGQTAGSLMLPVAAATPALFPMAENQDGSSNSQTQPAPANTVVTLFGTGEGLTDGGAPYAQPTLPVSLTVAGIPAQILLAENAPGLAGILQINARLPGGFVPSGQVAAILTVGSAASPPISLWLK